MIAALGVKRVSIPISSSVLADGPCYVGWRSNGEALVCVVAVDAQGEATARPVEHYPKHSPDGFGWGYSGSGPADLAYAILRDYLGQHAGHAMSRAHWSETLDDVAWTLHQMFKETFVAHFTGAWGLLAVVVGEWLRRVHEDPGTPCETRVALGFLLKR